MGTSQSPHVISLGPSASAMPCMWPPEACSNGEPTRNSSRSTCNESLGPALVFSISGAIIGKNVPLKQGVLSQMRILTLLWLPFIYIFLCVCACVIYLVLWVFMFMWSLPRTGFIIWKWTVSQCFHLIWYWEAKQKLNAFHLKQSNMTVLSWRKKLACVCVFCVCARI